MTTTESPALTFQLNTPDDLIGSRLRPVAVSPGQTIEATSADISAVSNVYQVRLDVFITIGPGATTSTVVQLSRSLDGKHFLAAANEAEADRISIPAEPGTHAIHFLTQPTERSARVAIVAGDGGVKIHISQTFLDRESV